MTGIKQVGIKQTKKDLKALSKSINKLATDTTTKVILNRHQMHTQFDEVEVIPYTIETTGQVVISAAEIETSSFSLESLLAQEIQGMTEDALIELNRGLKGVLK